MAWATISDVTNITGVTPDATTLAMSQSIVELHVEVSQDADDATSTRDLYWLKQAVCWQAAWLTDQPGYTARSEVTTVDQDGGHWDYKSSASVTLSPLAIRAIKNLSWMRSRTVQMSLPREPVYHPFNLESSDEWHLWRPL